MGEVEVWSDSGVIQEAANAADCIDCGQIRNSSVAWFPANGFLRQTHTLSDPGVRAWACMCVSEKDGLTVERELQKSNRQGGCWRELNSGWRLENRHDAGRKGVEVDRGLLFPQT